MTPAPASRFVVAAPHTGAGKTTVTAGLLAALRRRRLDVRPFKAGPDYIDPGFLARAAGRPARNLDGWLLDAPTLRWLFDRHVCGGAASIAVVEGMMGLFDGLSGRDDTGSTAHVARILDLPVVLVLDASRAARSIAAVARGCQVFDRRVRVAGWILNRVAGETHRRWVAEAVEQATRRPVFGSLPEDSRVALPERHLGLVQAGEAAGLEEIFGRLAHEVEQRFDLAGLLRGTRVWPAASKAVMPRALARILARHSGTAAVCRTRGSGTAASAASASSPPVIAWARDAAFTFHYADNVELLETLGARVVSWSPLVDHRLPRGTAAIVLGGGYPELFAKTLAENAAALDAVRQFVTRGGPVYAECGGLMYLARGIAAGGRRHRLAGVVPAWAEMTSRPRLAYVNAEPLRDTILTTRGTMLRGHEFHTSRLTPTPSAGVAAYRVVDAADRGGPARPRPDGYARGGVLASYVHVNFLGEPRLAERLLCRATAPRFRR